MATVIMPQLGESVTEGTVTRWIKQPNDPVALDEPLVEVDTEKVNVEIPSPFAGTLTAILVPEGATVPVGTPLAEITAAGEPARAQPVAAPPPAPSPPAPVEPVAPPAHAEPVEEPALPAVSAVEPSPPKARAAKPARAEPVTPQPVRPEPAVPSAARPEPVEGRAEKDAHRHYSPVVLRLAQEAGIDLSTIQGTGSGGRVTRQDVEAALARKQTPAARPEPVEGPTPAVTTPAHPEPAVIAPARPEPVEGRAGAPPVRAEPGEARTGDTVVPFSPMRRAIADHMLRSKQSAPHAWLAVEVDVSGLVAARAAHKEKFRAREGADLTYLAFVAHAVCQALHDHPRLNATWAGDQLIERHDVNLGIAVNVPDGLIVPVLRHADHLTVAALALAVAAVAERARAGKLKLDEVQGGTFTLDNTGALGSIYSGPIINHPEVAILTTEAIVKRPVVVEPDAIAVRSLMNLCLSFDHRAMDGALAIAFANRVKALLQAMDENTAIY